MANLISYLGQRAKAVGAQVNPFDNGRTYNTVMNNQAPPQAPVNGHPASFIQQLTHNGLTNTVGNLGVKPFVANPVQTALETIRAITAEATNNAAATNASIARQKQNISNSIPGFLVKNAANAGQAGYNLGFKAPILDIKGNHPAADQARTTGLKEFNRSTIGQAVTPIEDLIAKASHASKTTQASVGLDPNATFAQKYLADPLLGTAGTIGTIKAGKTTGELGVKGAKAAREFDKAQNQKGFIGGVKAPDFGPAKAKGETFVGPDKKTKFEVSDKGSSLKTQKGEHRLGDILHHPALFRNYPEMADVKVKFDPTANGGSYDSASKEMVIGTRASSKESERTRVHETQHAIQDIEDFASGTSPDLEYRRAYSKAVQEKNDAAIEFSQYPRHEMVIDGMKVSDMSPNQRASYKYMKAQSKLDNLSYRRGPGNYYKQYLASAGETEARATEARMNLSPAELKARPISKDYSVPANKQTVRFDSGRFRKEDSKPGIPIVRPGTIINAEIPPPPDLSVSGRYSTPTFVRKGKQITPPKQLPASGPSSRIKEIDQAISDANSGKSPLTAQQGKQLLKERQNLIDNPRMGVIVKGKNKTPVAPIKTSPAEVVAKPSKVVAKPAVTKNTPSESAPFVGIPKTPGAFKRAYQTVNGVISQHGQAGAEIARRISKSRDQSEIGQAGFLDKIPSVAKLNKGEFRTFVQALDHRSKGGQTAVVPKIQQAIDEWNKAIPSIRDRAVKAGLDVGDLGPNYFPRQYKDLFTSQKAMGKMAQHLVNTGKAKDLGEAINQLQFMRHEYQRPFGNLEKTRQADLPGYEMTHDALTNYISRSFDRITKAEQFGAKNETLHSLLGKAQSQGYDATPGNVLDRHLKIALGDVDKSTTAHKVSSAVRQFNAARSLSTAGISNATQLSNTLTVAGIARTAKGAARAIVSPKARADARQAGVLLDHSISELAKQGLGTKGAITSNLVSPFFRRVEKFNRMATAIVGKDYGNKLAKQGDTAQLRGKFGVEGPIGKTLTRDQEIQVSRKLVEISQFKVDPQDLPGWVDSPAGKLVAQFRTFGYKQTEMMYNQVLKEATRGNFLPLARFVAVGAPAGAASLALKGAIKGAPTIQGNDSPQKKALAGISQVGGFGLPGSEGLNIYNSIKYKNTPGAIAGVVGGPTVSFLTETGDNIRTGQQTGSYRKLEKEGIRSIPTVGPAIANRALPTTPAPLKADTTGTAQDTPQQRKANAAAEKKQLEADPNVGNGSYMRQLPNGQYAYYVDGDSSPSYTKDKQTAVNAIAEDSLKASGDSYKIRGETVYRKSLDGSVTAQPKIKFDYQVNGALLTAQKNAGDLTGYLSTAKSQLDNINKQLSDPSIDPLDQLTLQNDAFTIQSNIDKYTGYGGFTKPKAAKKARSASISSAYKTASTAKAPAAPKGISVRKLAAPSFKTTTKKLSVSKIPSNYTSKKLV